MAVSLVALTVALGARRTPPRTTTSATPRAGSRRSPGGFSIVAASPTLLNTAPDGSPSNALRANANVYINSGERHGRAHHGVRRQRGVLR